MLAPNWRSYVNILRPCDLRAILQGLKVNRRLHDRLKAYGWSLTTYRPRKRTYERRLSLFRQRSSVPKNLQRTVWEQLKA
jgi:hypothetical protein